jgi:hypothetical protein
MISRDVSRGVVEHRLREGQQRDLEDHAEQRDVDDARDGELDRRGAAVAAQQASERAPA